MNCSACEVVAQPIKVHGFDLCPQHASGMMTAVLTGDFTPVGYIIAASCGAEYVSVNQRPAVSKLETKRRSPCMQHGALPDAEPIGNLDPRGKRPALITGGDIPEHRTVKVANQKWRLNG